MGPGRVLLCLLGVFGASGCQDALTDPMVGLVAGESEGALALGISLPDPARLAPEEGLSLDGTRALEAWRMSWSVAPEDGHRAREAVYGDLARALAPTLDADRMEAALSGLSEGVAHARVIASEDLPPRLAEGVEEAETFREAAVTAWKRGRAVRAVEDVIRAADALREVGPEAVARALQREVEATFGRVSEGGPYSEKDLERLTRLVEGGRDALAEGSWVLAIRRAYYARALLQGND
jgi:hypothetical protein